MSVKTLIAAGCAAAALLAASAVAIAQEGPPPMGPPSAEMQQHMQEHHARMLADLRTVLRIRPDQEAAFKAFADSMAPKIVIKHGPDGPAADLTLPQMLAEHAKHEAQMAADMQSHDAAALALYNALSPDQQKTLDALVRLHHGMSAMGGMGGPGMGMPGMDGVRIVHMEMHGPMGGPPPQ